MKKTIQFFLIAAWVILSMTTSFGQTSKVTVLHNGSSSFFNNITPALAAAVSGDTIYLPGGAISPTADIHINKNLTIVGAGHYPDSTAATQITDFSNSTYSYIYINTGADGGSISGIKCSGLTFGTSPVNVSNYTIRRCRITNLALSSSSGSTSQNVTVSENVIDNVTNNGYGIANVIFEKNLINGSNISYGFAAFYINNVFMIGTGQLPGFYNSLLNNNIFITNLTYLNTNNASGCIFNNTLFCTTAASLAVNLNGPSTYNNSIQNQLASATFVNVPQTTFSYTYNYHLRPTSLGHNYGTDLTDLGIYGTTLPYKECAVPFNPHISSQTIANSLSPTGTLSVDIKVCAQDH